MAIQIVSRFFYGASSIVLKGYSSTAQNVAARTDNVIGFEGIFRHAGEPCVMSVFFRVNSVCSRRQGQKSGKHT